MCGMCSDYKKPLLFMTFYSAIIFQFPFQPYMKEYFLSQTWNLTIIMIYRKYGHVVDEEIR